MNQKAMTTVTTPITAISRKVTIPARITMKVKLTVGHIVTANIKPMGSIIPMEATGEIMTDILEDMEDPAVLRVITSDTTKKNKD